ncbi:MAG: ROK family protein [Tannerella sp.]|jgi:glucokinase|nr:ROK family protein [Tannerella sp.]
MIPIDNRIVMTLDAGGTNFVFTAIQDGKEIVSPLILSANPNNLESCLETLKQGFLHIKNALPDNPVAISFAFPGPADYPAGIIGDLPNFPSFRGGVALGPYLEELFKIPVFINNDGNLFAYGEALTGVLPEINNKLKAAGSIKKYNNLLGVTLGTGFGCGVVTDGQLLLGDNAAGGDIWCFRNKKHPSYIVEESVSIRAIKRVYTEYSGDQSDRSPKDIFDIAEGTISGNRDAAMKSFEELGEIAGDAIAAAITIVDGIVVVGGGLSGASKYIIPALVRELNATTGMMTGERFNRLQMKAFNLDDEIELNEFTRSRVAKVKIPGTTRTVDYDPLKRIGIITSKQGASCSIAMGAYLYALNKL